MKIGLFGDAEDFFLKRLIKKEEALGLLRTKDNTIIFQVSDGEPFTLIVNNGEISLRRGEVENSDLQLEADTNTYLRLFNGEISPAKAWVERKLFFRGIPWLGFPWITRLIKIGQEMP